ncbi:hypothetical protein BGZ46_004425 [Entomortierella lignicola]|nr:hypothetical protein BGZ46_004425 [Entomortierella lignicola]
MARYMGEGSEEVTKIGDSSGKEPHSVDDQYTRSESSYNDPLSSEDNTGEFSTASIEPPKRIIRIVGLGEPSSRLHLSHWVIKNEDVSYALMKSRASMMKNHESLQRPEEIL